MTDHYQAAERLLTPQEVPTGLRSTKMEPANPAVAQVHATLAVADQLARIATALERLAGGQESPRLQ